MKKKKIFDKLGLMKEFREIEEEISKITGIGDERLERYKELRNKRDNRIDELFRRNKEDRNKDYMYDAILSSKNRVVKIPKGYSAIVIASHYNGIMRYYDTYAIVKTKSGNEYLLHVPTYSKLEIGCIIVDK